MMFDLLQWGGFAGILLGYWFLHKPQLSATITIAGCASMLVWALMLTPPAWGVVALELACIIIGIRNWLK